MRNLFITCSVWMMTLVSQAQNFQWVKQGGGKTDDMASGAVSIDGSGNAYITGYFRDTAYFGNDTLISKGGRDIFITKYNDLGDLLWVISAGGKGSDEGLGLRVGASGLIYVTGYFSDTAWFDTLKVARNNPAGTDIFLAKIGTDGKIQWVRNAGGGANDHRGYATCVSVSGNIYVTGCFENTASFGTTNLTSRGGKDMFLAKYNSSGTLQWVRQGGGTGTDEAYDIAIDLSGNTFLTGVFESGSSFESVTLNSKGGSDIFVAKYNSSGGLMWAKQAGGSQNDRGKCIRIDGSGNSYAAGTFFGSAFFDAETMTANGSYSDLWLAKYNTAGAVQWVKRFGGIGTEDAGGINVDVNNSIYLSGSFEGEGVFQNDTLNSMGFWDYFVMRLDNAGSLQWITPAGGTGNETAAGVAIDNTTGNIMVAGTFDTQAGFGSFSLNGKAPDIFIARLDNIVGMEERTNELPVRVYPNPVYDRLFIMTAENLKFVELYDNLGRLVTREENCGTGIEINMKDYSPGVYLVKISLEGKQTTKKIIIPARR